MPAPSWSPRAKACAKREGPVLVQVFIQGKHVGKGHGSYGVASVCSHRDAVILAAVANNLGRFTDEQRAELERLFGLSHVEPKES